MQISTEVYFTMQLYKKIPFMVTYWLLISMIEVV